MTSKIVVNNIESDAGVSTVFFNSDIGGTGGTLNVDGNLNVDGVLSYEDVTNIDSVGLITARSGLQVTSGNVLVGTTDATIYNNGDSDSEGIVLRDGEVIDIARKGDLQLTLNRQTNDGFHVGFFRSGSPKSYIATRNDAFCIDVNNSERVRITSSGEVNVGGSDMTQTVYAFQVSKDLGTPSASGTSLARFKNANSTYSQDLYLKFNNSKDIIWEGGSGNGGMTCNMGTRGYVWQIGGSEKLRITSDGTLRQSGSNSALGQGDSVAKLTQYTIDGTTPGGVGDVTTLETISATSNGSDYKFIITKREGSGGGSCFINLGGNSDGSISFGTNTSGSGTERLRITSGGDMGLGTASPTARLDVRRDDADGKIAEFHQSTGYGIQIRSSQSVATIRAEYNQALVFETGTTATERLRIHSNGSVTKPSNPAFLVGRTGGNHTFTLGTFPFNVARINVGSCWDTSTYKFTAPTAGIYYFFGQVYYNSGDGDFRVAIRKTPNGGSGIQLCTAACDTNGSDESLTVSIMESLSVGDTIELYSDQNASRTCYYNINQNTYGAHTYFMGYLVS